MVLNDLTLALADYLQIPPQDAEGMVMGTNVFKALTQDATLQVEYNLDVLRRELIKELLINELSRAEVLLRQIREYLSREEPF